MTLLGGILGSSRDRKMVYEGGSVYTELRSVTVYYVVRMHNGALVLASPSLSSRPWLSLAGVAL